MKRHSSLIPLSREHHNALILARSIQKDIPTYKGMPADAEGKTISAQKFYTDELIKHFEEEEKMLELIKGINAPLDELSAMMLDEHRELHRLFQSLDNSNDMITSLDDLGKRLESHIRTEERRLFPLIQESCDEATLVRIEKILTA